MAETSSSTSSDNDPVQVLNSLHNRRTTIEKVISVAIMLEKLHQNLQTVILLGKSSNEISTKIRQTLQKLDEKVRILPTQKLQELTGSVDLLIKEELKGIITIINQNNVDSVLHKKSDQLVKQLQHRAQTAVALRVTLEERGVRTKPITLGIPPELLRKKVATLKKQEGEQREHLKTDLKSMHTDIQVVLSSTDFPEKMREVAQEMKSGIEENIKHLDSGKPITNMPMAIELVESGNLGESYNIPTEEELLEDVPQTTESTQNDQAEPQEHTKEPSAKLKKGLITRFLEWLNTPWSRSWEDIQKSDKNPPK